MLKTFFLPYGRMGRLRFWRAVAFIGIAYQVVSLTSMDIIRILFAAPAIVTSVVVCVLTVIAFWCAATVGVQRLHDRDRSAWWLLLALVPVGGAIWYLFANGTMAGTRGPNRYGLSTDGRHDEIAEVFGEGGIPRRKQQQKGGLVGTIVLWLAFLTLSLMTLLLFQNPEPQRHAARDIGASAAALTNGKRHTI